MDPAVLSDDAGFTGQPRLPSRQIDAAREMSRALSGRSGCGQSCRGQGERIILDDQPALGRGISTGHLEVRHLPVADFCRIDQIVQVQPIANTRSLPINDNVEQPSTHEFNCLLAWRLPAPVRHNILPDYVFSHAGQSSRSGYY